MDSCAGVEVVTVFEPEVFTIDTCFEFRGEHGSCLKGYESLCSPGVIYRIPGGIILRDREEVFSSSCALYDDFTTQKVNPGRLLRRGSFSPQLKLKGSVLNLSLSGLEDNYYHLLVEWLARWKLFKSSNLDCEYFVLPGKNSFQLDLVKLLGVRPESIVSWGDCRSLAADEVMVPSFINNCSTVPLGNGYYSYPKTWMPSWSIDSVQELYQICNPVEDKKRRERVYISRARSSKRIVLNEDELLQGLMEYGFDVVYCEDLTLNEQISLFAGVHFIVAPHGAGLVNLIHMKHPQRVLEFHPSSYVDTSFWIACSAANVEYDYMSCEAAPDDRLHPKDWSYYVDCSKVECWLEQYC